MPAHSSRHYTVATNPQPVSRPSRSTHRSGDPRKRAVQAPPPGTSARKRLVVVVLVTGVAFLAFAVLALRDGDREPDAQARAHAESACDLTSQADEAARVNTDARYAATVLVLDQALLESAGHPRYGPDVSACPDALSLWYRDQGLEPRTR
jgi:hypothetical protein